MTTPGSKNDLRIIVVGTSAGGLAALRVLVGAIDQQINAAIFVVQHTTPDGPGLLPHILQPLTPLPVAHARDQEPIRRGRVYVAPPNRHLVVDAEQVLTTLGPRENFARPAVDPLFRSAALAHGPRVIGVILTGRLDDGSAGLWAVKERGGIAIVQDPRDAEYAQMPQNALSHVRIDHCVPLAQIGPLLGRLAEKSLRSGDSTMPKGLELETRIAKEEQVSKRELLQLGDPSVFTCPECHGALLQLKNSPVLRFRCHTGHAYSLESLIAQLNSDIESNLWTAIRSIEEYTLLLDHVAKHLQTAPDKKQLAQRIGQTAREAERRAGKVREVVMHDEPLLIDELEMGATVAPAALRKK